MSDDDRVSKTTLIAAMIGTIVATVVALEATGKLKHNDDKSLFPIAEYKVIVLKPGQEMRLASKPAPEYGYCDQGFLFIQSETDPNLKGPLVDFKNRGVHCEQPDSSSNAGTADAAPATPAQQGAQ